MLCFLGQALLYTHRVLKTTHLLAALTSLFHRKLRNRPVSCWSHKTIHREAPIISTNPPNPLSPHLPLLEVTEPWSRLGQTWEGPSLRIQPACGSSGHCNTMAFLSECQKCSKDTGKRRLSGQLPVLACNPSRPLHFWAQVSSSGFLPPIKELNELSSPN